MSYHVLPLPTSDNAFSYILVSLDIYMHSYVHMEYQEVLHGFYINVWYIPFKIWFYIQ